MKINTLFLALTLLLLINLTHCQDDGDWVDPSLLPIDFVVHGYFAGYIKVSEGRYYFYVYHPSESNPSKDPVMLRVSSGGCSSLYSQMYSKGPIIFTPYTPNTSFNANRWNKQANLLFIEGPAGVGFSFDRTEVKKNMTDSDYVEEMIQAIYSFYYKFPELRDQDLYLSGQQYAGITIPKMAKRIIEINNDRYIPVIQKIKLKGFLLENPCTMRDQCQLTSQYSHYTYEYLRNHYFISREQYSAYFDNCTIQPWSSDCKQSKDKIQKAFVETRADITSLYKQCHQQTGPQKYKCMDTLGILQWTQNNQVRIAWHIDPSIQKWDLCNDTIIKNWQRDPLGSLRTYQELLREERDLRIWIVSGSLSAETPTLGTRIWVESLKNILQRPATRVWDAWKFNGEINAGLIEEFRGLSFISVRSAGLRIYSEQPEIGYYIYDSFMKGRRL